MSWEPGSIMRCDTCWRASLDVPAQPKVVMAQYARSKGWFVYEGPLMSGRDVISHICNDCMGSARSKLPAPPPKLEEDQKLF